MDFVCWWCCIKSLSTNKTNTYLDEYKYLDKYHVHYYCKSLSSYTLLYTNTIQLNTGVFHYNLFDINFNVAIVDDFCCEMHFRCNILLQNNAYLTQMLVSQLVIAILSISTTVLVHFAVVCGLWESMCKMTFAFFVYIQYITILYNI